MKSARQVAVIELSAREDLASWAWEFRIVKDGRIYHLQVDTFDQLPEGFRRVLTAALTNEDTPG